MRTIVFYTKEQNHLLEEELVLGNKPSKIANKYAHMWSRNRIALEQKIGKMRKQLAIPHPEKPIHIKKIAVKEPIVIKEAKLTLPEGMTFEGTAKRVELHSNHFRVYF